MKRKYYVFFFTCFLSFLGLRLAEAQQNWLEIVSGYEQPGWFNSHRVHIHTRNAQYWNPDTELFSEYGEMVSPLGVEVYTRHVKTREELYFQSSVGSWEPQANTRNVIQEAINNAHENGCRMIAYYTHYTDGYFRENYPKWQCRDVNGKTIEQIGRGFFLCMNTPFSDSVLVRLLEVAAMGADGIYFDGKHMPSNGCWCDFCKAKFKKQTGLDAPTKVDGSQLYKDYQTFNNNSINETFFKWRQALLEKHPEVVMVVGSNLVPRFSARHLNTGLLRVAGAHKTEWNVGVLLIKKGIIPSGIALPNLEVFRGLDYTFDRDIGDGRPAHVWIPGMSFVPANHIKAAAAGQITFGNIANIDMKESFTPDEDFIDAIVLGKKVSPVMHDSKPLRWVLIHYNEKSQEKYLPNETNSWKNNLYPMYGAYYTAHQLKLPVGFITDSQMEKGMFQNAKVLFLPDPNTISSEMQAKINEFKNAGGIVISQSANWNWYLGGTNFNNAKNELASIFKSISNQPLMESEGGSGFYHAQYYQKQDADTLKYIAAYSNRLNWIVSESTKERADIELAHSNQPVDVSGVKLKIRKTEIPLQIREAVSDQLLSYSIEKDQLVIDVPAFQFNALIEIAYLSTTSVNASNREKPRVIYPNPVKDKLRIDLYKWSHYRIYTVDGKKILEGDVSNGVINVKTLGKGIYILKIDSDKSIYTRKFIKQ